PGVPSWIPAANADGERARTTDRSLAEALAAHNGRDYETAEQCYSQALASSADVSVRSFIYNHRGMVRFMMENARDALHDFTAAVEANPRNHSALNNRALALRRLGLVEAALDDFSSSLEIRPEQPDIHFLIGQTYFELGDPARSRAAIRRALSQDPNHPDAMALKERLGSDG
ncbi:MAG: tetratricopeptide repeat protein, partial [Polyangiales bacterium]